MVTRFNDMAKIVCEFAKGNIPQAIVQVEEALEFLKHHESLVCDHRTEWICYRDIFVYGCKSCPAYTDKVLYQQEQTEKADKICIKRNMLMFGDDYKISDDCCREDIAVGKNGKNCDECPAYDDLIEFLGECKAAKTNKTALAVENIEMQVAKKIKLIQSQQGLY